MYQNIIVPRMHIFHTDPFPYIFINLIQVAAIGLYRTLQLKTYHSAFIDGWWASCDYIHTSHGGFEKLEIHILEFTWQSQMGHEMDLRAVTHKIRT